MYATWTRSSVKCAPDMTCTTREFCCASIVAPCSSEKSVTSRVERALTLAGGIEHQELGPEGSSPGEKLKFLAQLPSLSRV